MPSVKSGDTAKSCLEQGTGQFNTAQDTTKRGREYTLKSKNWSWSQETSQQNQKLVPQS